MKSSGQQLLEQLLTEDLSGVTFVRDYLQLQFNPPPTVNVYTVCTVRTKDGTASFGDSAFPNMMIRQIGKHVSAVSQDDELFVITFEDMSRIEIPLHEAARRMPEAFEFWGRDGQWGVWPG